MDWELDYQESRDNKATANAAKSGAKDLVKIS